MALSIADPAFDRPINDDTKQLVIESTNKTISMILQTIATQQTSEGSQIFELIGLISFKYERMLDSFFRRTTMYQCLLDSYHEAVAHFTFQCMKAAVDRIATIDELASVIAAVYKNDFILTWMNLRIDLSRAKSYFACNLADDIIMQSHVEDYISFLHHLYASGDVIAALKKCVELHSRVQVSADKKNRYSVGNSKYNLSSSDKMLELYNKDTARAACKVKKSNKKIKQRKLKR